MRGIIVKAAALAALGLLAACSKPQAKAPPYNTDYAMREVMGHVIDPAAQAVWRASGEVVTKEGVQSLRPTTEEGWLAAESGAVTVAEAANVLMLPGRARDDTQWMTFATSLHDSAVAAQKAIEAKDDKKMFETGAALYQVCTGCHATYLLPYLDPKTGEPAPTGPDGKPNPLLKDRQKDQAP